MTIARLYGRFFGNTSLAVVTRGFDTALREAGILSGTVHVESEESEDDDRAGADARHGIYVGALGKLDEMMKRGLHRHYWLMVTPNSNRLPEDLIQALRQWATEPGRHFIAPSTWAAEVVESELRHEAHVVPHGVSEEFQINQEISAQTARDYMKGEFRVLHFSSSARQRKGTLELIQAWKIASLGAGSRLLCVMDAEAGVALYDAMAEEGITLPPSVQVMNRADLPAASMAKNLARAHVVCQPSRGEGFGLLPLEALASGVPVVATLVTGHRDYLRVPPASGSPTRRGVVPVMTGPLSPLDDVPGSLAPALDPAEIVRALGIAKQRWPELQEEAMGYAPSIHSHWSWQASLDEFLERLRVT